MVPAPSVPHYSWRNHAMHFREHYEGSEAKTILEHVKAFMAQLADGGLKE
jgi:hypothetical protein